MKKLALLLIHNRSFISVLRHFLRKANLGMLYSHECGFRDEKIYIPGIWCSGDRSNGHCGVPTLVFLRLFPEQQGDPDFPESYYHSNRKFACCWDLSTPVQFLVLAMNFSDSLYARLFLDYEFLYKISLINY